MTVHTPKIEIFSQNETTILKLQGWWVAKTAKTADPLCANLLQKNFPNRLVFDLTECKSFDTTGVWLLHKTWKALEHQGYHIELQNVSEAFQILSEKLKVYQQSFISSSNPNPNPNPKFFFAGNNLVELGKTSVAIACLARDLVTFLGEATVGIFLSLLHPKRLRFTSIIAHMERFGVDAIPIIFVMSTALGLVLAYQGEEQLRQFGAEIYTINLVSISMLREVGILITAILVAGRTGSSIAAQIGIMKINQEIDALNTLGLNTMDVLIIPRILALIIIMPLLAFVSDIAGLVGGGIMVIFSLDVSPLLYVQRVGEAVTAGSFWVGILKAPLFGAVIGIVGCFEGMRVEGTAESVGFCTTRAVVEAIFLVTLTDAFLSVFFSAIGI